MRSRLSFCTAGAYREQDGGFGRGAPGAGVRRQGRSGLALRTGLRARSWVTLRDSQTLGVGRVGDGGNTGPEHP